MIDSRWQKLAAGVSVVAASCVFVLVAAPAAQAVSRCKNFVPGANLSRCDLKRANLSGKNLTGANLARANLTLANVSKAKLAGTDHSAAISAIALELLEKRSAVSHLESLAMAADQNLSTLRYAWIDANAKLAQMQDDFAQRLRSDPQWQSAKIQLEQARTSLASISQ